MELKNYQIQVLKDLDDYINELLITKNTSTAYLKHWKNKNVRVGFDGMKPYVDVISGVPSVCLKVPTGGGKTYIGCSCIKRVLDKMTATKKKAVVWLVPWDTILTQTYDNLSNPNHFYHQQLVRDFSGKVEIYNKKQALSSQNLNASAVNEQLSIFVLSFDTFRSRSKENRKVYEANSNLAPMTAIYEDRDSLIPNVDETSLIQVLNQLNPIVIIDESHNAKSDLSFEMIKNLNPSFVVELTATPKEKSNIISIVPADALKAEHMVKLPVIAYNRPSVERVIVEAIDLQATLERHAKKINDSESSDKRTYIRPIVLFQAQPKHDDDNVTFDKIKKELIEAGIPEEQIAIKTANKNEIAGMDLMSPTCKIRYIITINALKEGWDCPFAYILASLANKTSKVDVEQILGRILRQPYQKEYADKILNMSYVLSCSNDFNETLKSIIDGLNSSGFSKNDCRVITSVSEVNEDENKGTDSISNLFDLQSEIESNIQNVCDENIDSTIFNINDVTNEIKETIKKLNDMQTTDEGEQIGDIEISLNPNISVMLEDAVAQNERYEEEIEISKQEGTSGVAPELRANMNNFKMNASFKEEFENMMLPQFCLKTGGTLFADDNVSLISKEDLTNGFKLSDITTPNNLSSSVDNVYKIDVITTEEGTFAKQYALSKNDSEEFKKHLTQIPEQSRVSSCKTKLLKDLNNKFNCIGYNDLKKYIDRIVDELDEDQLVDLQSNIMSVELKIKNFIENALDDYRYKFFKSQIEVDKIFLNTTYKFPLVIHPNSNMSFYPLSLYTEEEDNLTDVETDFASKVSNLSNVKCWHRIIERKGFYINGFINHYPDFVVFTKKGKIILVETKGEHLANDDSAKKLELGTIWANKAGYNKYRYYMAFLINPMDAEGSYQVDKLIEIISNL